MQLSIEDMLARANALVPRIGASEARDLIGREDALLVDVRDDVEIAATGHLQSAVQITMESFSANPAENHLLHEAFRRGRIVILYCAHGIRSALAGYSLRQDGFERVYNLGGFDEAEAAGFEVEARQG